MKKHIQCVKDKLLETIHSLESLKSMYVQDADKRFTRNRKLSFETVIKLILEMEGNTLAHELRHYFSFSLDMPTVALQSFESRSDRIAQSFPSHNPHMYPA